MKKYKVVIPSLLLASPIIALPLINAASIKHNDDSMQLSDGRRLTETNDLVVKWGANNKSNFTVRFMTRQDHPEWGEYGEIYKVKMGEVEPKWSIPATVTQGKIEYKIRGIDTRKRWDSDDYKSIKVLDLSNAQWLDYIATQSFDNHKDDRYPVNHIAVRQVNFAGANSLTTIGNRAFRDCKMKYDDGTFQPRPHIWDFSASKLTTLEHRTFQTACTPNANNLDMIIFPRTLTTLGQDCFGYAELERDSRVRFKKVIYTDTEPQSGLFGKDRSMPHTLDTKKAYNQIIVPPGCAEKYKSLPNFNHDFDRVVYESKIEFNEQHQGNTDLLSTYHVGGFDPASWTPYHVEQTKVIENANMRLSNDFDGKIWLDADNRVNWSPDLEPGQYRFSVQAFIYDDDKNEKMSVAVSNPITLTVVKNVNLSGGSNNLFLNTAKSGKDTKSWEPIVPGFKMRKTEYEIISPLQGIGLELKSQETALGKYDRATIKWEQGVQTGHFVIELKVKIYVEGCELPLICSRQIKLHVADYAEDFTFSATITNVATGESKDYEGEPITEKSTVTLTLNIPSSYLQLYDTLVSVNSFGKTDIIQPTMSGNKTTFTVDPGDSWTHDAHYSFVVYGYPVKRGLEDTVSVYSNKIDVRTSKALDIYDLPSDIYVKKTISGSQVINVVPDTLPDIEISNVELSLTPWNFDSYDQKKYLSVGVAENKKDVIFSWDKQFCEVEGWLDYYDIRLEITLHSTATNEDQKVMSSMSIVTTDKAEIKYEGEDVLYGYAQKVRTFESPFKMMINDKQPEDVEKLHYDCFVKGHEEEYRELIGMEQNEFEAQLKCGIVPEPEDPTEGLTVTVYAYDENHQVIASRDVLLYIGNILELSNVPSEVKSDYGVGGKTDKFKATFNGEEDPTITYKLQGDSSFKIRNNCLTWDKSIEPGAYVVTITASKDNGLKVYSDTKYVQVVIGAKPEPEEKLNIGLIAGVSAGGVAVVGGTTAGITIGVKKHKAKLGKKKK